MKHTKFRSFKEVQRKQSRHKARRAHNLALYRAGIDKDPVPESSSAKTA